MTYSKSTESKPLRIDSIDVMIALAMILVVVGHFKIGNEPLWYSRGLWSWIYSFHMQLFVFLSAFLIRYAAPPILSLSQYGKYIFRKASKFIPAYWIVGLLGAALDAFFHHDSISSSLVHNVLYNLLLCPRCSSTSFLWYLYLLMAFYIISPLLFRLPQWCRVLGCILAMFLPNIPTTNLLCLFDFCQYTFFYFLGILCSEWINDLRLLKRWHWALLSLPFALFSAWLLSVAYHSSFDVMHMGWWSLPVGLSALPFFYLLGSFLSKYHMVMRVMRAISLSCYWIYLSQMFIIWACVWVLLKLSWLSSLPFALSLIIVSSLAIAIPILLHYLFSHKKRDSCNKRPAKNTSLK